MQFIELKDYIWVQTIYNLTQLIFMTRINFNFVFFAFLFISVFVYSSSFAQLEQGTFILNEHFSFSTSKTENNNPINSNIYTNKDKHLDFNTSFGYLFKDKQELGIALGIGRENYENSNTDFNNNYENNSKRYGVSLYYKKYVSLAEKLHFFVSPRIGYRYDMGERKEDNNDVIVSDSKTNTLGVYLYTGFLYNISPKVGLSINLVGAGLQYSSSKEKRDNGYTSTSSSFSSSMYDYFGFGGLNLGVQFML